MEKKRLLGAYYNAALLTLVCMTIGGCSLPRLVVLHDPLTSEEHVSLGISYEKKGEGDAALREYRAAAKEQPVAWLYIGNVYFGLKDYDKAETAYRKAIKKTQNAHAYNNLAWLYYTTDRRLDKAETLAAEAVRLSPEDDNFKDTLERIREKSSKAANP